MPTAEAASFDTDLRAAVAVDFCWRDPARAVWLMTASKVDSLRSRLPAPPWYYTAFRLKRAPGICLAAPMPNRAGSCHRTAAHSPEATRPHYLQSLCVRIL
ncbi:hypothetical protein Cs7R123_44180 [Catellatospora sp. TT07R-123]|nr:hypothetical protein Cs7R123_44180 [Catellatospora sp. TT07R-123]